VSGGAGDDDAPPRGQEAQKLIYEYYKRRILNDYTTVAGKAWSDYRDDATNPAIDSGTFAVNANFKNSLEWLKLDTD